MKHYVNFDGEYLYKQLDVYKLKSGYGKEYLSEKLGYSKSYIAGMIRHGRGNEDDLRVLCIKAHIDYDRLVEKHNPYSVNGLPPREHTQRQIEKAKAYIKPLSYKNDVREMLEAVTAKQQEINSILVKVWEELNHEH